ncbi:MAG TPA: urease subunit alpha [Gaiellales bacterium]|nr:urease subunit alpha [Gaiellales bacterium]
MPAPERVALGDGDLWVTPERDDAGGPDEIVPGWGGTHRDGLGVRAERGGVDIAVVGGLVLDPAIGIRRTSIGVRGGRVCAIGRAGNPDTMDGIDVVLDSQTALVDARGMVITPGGVDCHMHWLSPQLGEAALAGGITTIVAQDYGPIWNLGANPAAGLRAAWAALEETPLNVAFLVRASASRPEGVEESLAAGGAGLKIHEDVAAGPEQLRCALDVADRHDVQLAIHTDGLNEALRAADTARVLEGRTAHLYHIEGVGGGHAPDLLSLAGRERLITSSTNPTVPYGVGAEAEHMAMVAAVHLLEPGARAGDAAILRARVRAWTMAAESALHDLGVIPILSSDSQGMGRISETVRRAFQCAAAMKAQRGGAGADDNERVLRYLAKVTVNPAVAHGLAAHVGSLREGRLADLVVWRPELFPVRPELVLKAGMPAWGASGAGGASTMMAEPVCVGPQIAATGAGPGQVSLAFLARSAMAADLPTTRERAQVSDCRALTAADMAGNSRTGAVVVDAASETVTLDGEPVACEPVTEVAYSRRYLL